MTDTENFIVDVAKLVRQSIDSGQPFIELDLVINLFEKHFDMKEILS